MKTTYGEADLDWGPRGDYYTPTLASCDRLWTVVLFDDDPPFPGLRHSMLFFLADGGLAYDLEDDVLFWTDLREAREAQARLQAEMDERAEARGFGSPTLYLLNWGDHAREERRVFGLSKRWAAPRKASEAALAEWRRRNELVLAALEAESDGEAGA